MSSIMSGFSISGTQSNRLDFSDYPTNVCHEHERRKR
jgi:hypothetical protein